MLLDDRQHFKFEVVMTEHHKMFQVVFLASLFAFEDNLEVIYMIRSWFERHFVLFSFE